MEYYKYPRTMHLPWSENITSDDKIITDLSVLKKSTIVVSEKMDGENTTLYKDHFHARSIDSLDHESRHWIKRYHAEIAYKIPENYRICGENLFARHSIPYENLPTYFLVFSVWYKDQCLSVPETINFCNKLELFVVPQLYVGNWDENVLISKGLIKQSCYGKECEGYVVRNLDSFLLKDFDKNIAKFVRKNHVQTNAHWMYSKLERNKLLI